MLSKSRSRNAIIVTSLCFALLFMPIGLELSSQDNPSFDGTGFLLFLTSVLIVAYISVLAYSLLAEEIQDRRMKLWVSLPVSRLEVFRTMLTRLLVRCSLLPAVMILCTITLIYVLFDVTPGNPLAIIIGYCQFMLVLMMINVVLGSMLQAKLALILGIVLPLVVLFLQMRSSFSIVTSGSTGGSVFIAAINLLVPIGVGFRNMVYGHTPLLMEQVGGRVYTNMGSIVGNLYPVIWLVFVLLLIYQKVKRAEY